MWSASKSCRTGRIAWIAAGLMVAAMPAAPEDQPDVAAAGRGRTSYARYCKVCHGDRAEGDGVLAKDLKVAPGDLTRLNDDDGQFPFEKVENAISKSGRVRGHGSADMPAWGKAFEKTEGTGAATPEEAVADLAQFLWSIQKKGPAK